MSEVCNDRHDDLQKRWREAFGALHSGGGRGFRLRWWRWRGVSYLRATPRDGVKRWAAFLAQQQDDGRLALVRVTFAGTLARLGVNGRTKAARVVPTQAPHGAWVAGWTCDGMGSFWGRRGLLRDDVWASWVQRPWDGLGVTRGERAQVQRILGPVRAATGRGLRGPSRLNVEPPWDAVVPQMLWVPSRNRLNRRRLNGQDRAAHAARRRERSEAWHNRRAGFRIN